VNEGGERSLRQFRAQILTTVALILVVSAIVLVISGVIQGHLVRQFAGLAAGALFSGALTALVFTTLASRETDRQLDISLDNVLRRVFLPLRGVVEKDAVSRYQYRTHLTRVGLPDTKADYCVQLIRVGYTGPPLASEVRIVCISSYDDRALAPFTDTSRYLLRWQIDPKLNPADNAIFMPECLYANGERLVGATTTRSIDEHSVCEYRYKVPRHLRQASRCRVEMTLLTRKYVEDKHVIVKVLLFRNVTDAEFQCTVDSSVECKRLSVAANVSAIGPKGEGFSGTTYVTSHSTVSAHVSYGYPLQEGSSITFYLDRA
jgi:hypothetical protein